MTVKLTEEMVLELIERARQSELFRAQVMPDEKTAILFLFQAWQRLQELGWKATQYAPRDGRALDLIEMGSTGIHRGYCRERPSSDFPMKWLWVEDDDLYPSNAVLFREAQCQKSGKEGGNA